MDCKYIRLTKHIQYIIGRMLKYFLSEANPAVRCICHCEERSNPDSYFVFSQCQDAAPIRAMAVVML